MEPGDAEPDGPGRDAPDAPGRAHQMVSPGGTIFWLSCGIGPVPAVLSGADSGGGVGRADEPWDPEGDPWDPAAETGEPAGDPCDPEGDPGDPASDPCDPEGGPCDPASDPRDPEGGWGQEREGADV